MKGLERAWYGDRPWLGVLTPVEWLFRRLADRRRQRYQRGVEPVWRAPVPVIVVGNITLGGTGKTPLIVTLIERLCQAGYRPGVVSRGYGGRAPGYPWVVTADSLADQVGDEPLMLVRRTGCPLVVSPRRSEACQTLLERFDCDLILSDDGLQHYALGRDLEIAVVDGARGLGNGRCLPVGPLREPPSRLREVDFVVVNGGTWHCPGSHSMALEPGALHTLGGTPAESFAGPVNAVAGIGNPSRFFDTLAGLGYEVIPRPFPDHHRFSARDLCFNNGFPVIMTEKDAVKCRAFASRNRYYLAVNAALPDAFFDALIGRLAALKP